MISVRQSPSLMDHLKKFEHDGATVASLLFDGDRLSYPGRKEIEFQLGYVEPYTLELESRIIEGLNKRAIAAIKTLARFAKTASCDIDPTLELLWESHEAWDSNGVSLDRLVAALVGIEIAVNVKQDDLIDMAATVVVSCLHAHGFPLTTAGFEELFDGAPPACVGLCLVDL